MLDLPNLISEATASLVVILQCSHCTTGCGSTCGLLCMSGLLFVNSAHVICCMLLQVVSDDKVASASLATLHLPPHSSTPPPACPSLLVSVAQFIISQTCQPSRFWLDSPAFLPDVPLNHGNGPLFVRSRIFVVARAQFVTLPRCPDVNANHTIERNYGNSVRFLAKIPNGTAAESPCYSVFWNAIDFCRLYTSKKFSMWALPSVPLFAGKSCFFTRNVPLKTFSRLAGLISLCSGLLD